MDIHAQPVNTLDALRDKITANDPAAAGEKVLLMGAGNIIMADEGIGPVAVDYLHKHFDFPPNIALVDVATTGIGMLSNLEGMDHLIIIDAADNSGHLPGTVIFYTPEDLAAQQVMHSAHDQRLTDVLFAASLTGIELQSVAIVGVQIARLAEFVLELSEPVKEAVPIACAGALHKLRELGFEARPKPEVQINPALLDALENFAPEDQAD